ncbi:hypothetical protein D9M71_462260 [compost metagenome]
MAVDLFLRHQPVDAAGQLGQLQRLRLPLQPGMQGLDAAEHLAHVRRLGRIGKALIQVPLGQRGEVRPQGRAGQGLGVIRQITGNRLTAGGQEATPGVLEMGERLLIAALGAFAPRGLPVAIDLLRHRRALLCTGKTALSRLHRR